MKKNRVTKADIRLYLPFFVVFCLSVFYHLRMHPMGGDDPFFAAALDGTSLPDYLAGRYRFWTSRIVLEAILVLVIKAPWLWRILNLLFYASLPVLFTKLLWDGAGYGGCRRGRLTGEELRNGGNYGGGSTGEELRNGGSYGGGSAGEELQDGGSCGGKNDLLCWCSAAAVLLYPLHDMGTAGWITTTETHFWPLWGILFLALQVRHIAFEERMSPIAAVCSIPVAVMTGSHEQYAVILLVLLILCAAYKIVRRSKWGKGLGGWIFGLYWLISLASLAVIAACPGNAARNEVSLADLPVYKTFGFGDKLYLGLLSIERVFIANADIVFFAVTLLLAVLVYVKTGSYRKTLVSSVPFLILIGHTVIRTAFPGFSSLFPVPGEVLEWSWGELTTWMPMVYLILTVAAMLFAFYQLFGENPLEYLYVLLFLGCGFGAGAVLGFMATIYVSGERVYAALYVILMLTVLHAVQKLREPLREKCRTAGGRLLVTFFALLCLANVLFEVLSIT